MGSGVGVGVGAGGGDGITLKVAVTSRTADIVTVQVPVPEHAALQPANSEPLAGVAVRVTAVPSAKSCVQSDPQEIPDGEEDTVPFPDPRRETSSGNESVFASIQPSAAKTRA